jgi:hypothetical protein
LCTLGRHFFFLFFFEATSEARPRWQRKDIKVDQPAA